MRTMTIVLVLFCAGCASNPYTEENPSPFTVAAQSWVGYDVHDMAKAYGTPTEFVKGSDAILDPTVVLWIDSDEKDLPAYERKPQEVTGYDTNCNSYGNTTNCNTTAVTNNNNQAMEEAGYNFGNALAKAAMHRCNVSARVDPETNIILHVETDQKSFRQCEKSHDIAKLTRPTDDQS